MDSKRRKKNGSELSINLGSVKFIKDRDIPEWMLFEVLMRLPVKVLFKFKIVSKQWHSMISDPSFARMYVARTSTLSSHAQNWTLIRSFTDKATTKHYIVQRLPLRGCSLDINCPLILPPAQQVLNGSVYIILGISNGLVLYSPYVPCVDRSCGIDGYNICNPITGQWITLPPSEHNFAGFFTGFVTQVEDNALASYRVVRIDAYLKKRVFMFEVYFSEIRRWMDFNIDFNQVICFNEDKKPVALGKILHWIISGHRIVAYDPYNKPDSCNLISLPGVVDASFDANNIIFDKHQGHLRYLAVALGGRLNGLSRTLSIWLLNDYDSGEWCQQHRVRIDDIHCDFVLFLSPRPLFFHPFDSNIVNMDNYHALHSYDVKARKLETPDYSRNNYSRFYYLRSFLFVLPPWPVSIKPFVS